MRKAKRSSKEKSCFPLRFLLAIPLSILQSKYRQNVTANMQMLSTEDAVSSY